MSRLICAGERGLLNVLTKCLQTTPSRLLLHKRHTRTSSAPVHSATMASAQSSLSLSQLSTDLDVPNVLGSAKPTAMLQSGLACRVFPWALGKSKQEMARISRVTRRNIKQLSNSSKRTPVGSCTRYLWYSCLASTSAAELEDFLCAFSCVSVSFQQVKAAAKEEEEARARVSFARARRRLPLYTVCAW